jgi:hypothetical protein
MYVNVILKAVWQFRDFPEYKVTKCKKVIKGNKLLMYNKRGFYINGRYLKRNEINQYLEKIPIEKCPF